MADSQIFATFTSLNDGMLQKSFHYYKKIIINPWITGVVKQGQQ